MSSPKSINFKVKSNDYFKDKHEDTAKRFVIAQYDYEPSLFECPYDLDKVYGYWVKRDTLYVQLTEGDDDLKVIEKHNYDDDEKKYPYVICVCNKDEVIDDQGWGCFETAFETPPPYPFLYEDKRFDESHLCYDVVSSKEFHNHTSSGLMDKVRALKKENEELKAKADAYVEAQQKEMECLKALKDKEIDDLKMCLLTLGQHLPVPCDGSRILSNYREEMDTMTEILKDTPLSEGYENDEGENRFQSIDDLQELAKEYVKVKAALDGEHKLTLEIEQMDQTIEELRQEVAEQDLERRDLEDANFEAEKYITELKAEIFDLKKN